jgi:hypothetical protein
MKKISAAISLLLLSASPSIALDIFFCGQAVPSNQVGVLTADLNCIGDIGVLLDPYAELDMNGHQISGGTTGVLCLEKRCEIHGPGRITGASLCGVQAANNPGHFKILIDGVDIDNTQCAVAGSSAKDISLRVENVNVTDNLGGLSAGRITATNLIATGNANGAVDGRRGIRLIDSTITANPGIGVIARRGVLLRDSVVTGNDATNGYDVAAQRRPRLDGGTCGRSVVIPKVFVLPSPGDSSWGVCTDD